jgi:hypothetical protein
VAVPREAARYLIHNAGFVQVCVTQGLAPEKSGDGAEEDTDPAKESTQT